MKPMVSRADIMRGLLLLGISICFVQVLFWRIQHIDAQKASGVVAAILRDENNLINPQRVSQALLDLRETGFIACAQIERTGSEAPFLSRDKNPACESVAWLLRGEPIATEIAALDGHPWKVSFRSVNPPIFDVTLWISRLIAGALAGSVLYIGHRSRKRHYLELEVEKSKAAFAESLAKQVSHDIRSPLSAIGMVVKTLSSIPEEKRLLIEHATARINGIAGDLLMRYRAPASDAVAPRAAETHGQKDTTLAPVVISELLRRIYDEKAVLLQAREGITFRLDLTGPQDAVCTVDEKELSRALSNLINNAADAIEKTGTVVLALRAAMKDVAIIISDDGKGIPADILARLGKETMSSGKMGTESGAGLGVFHAVKSVEAMGGRLAIQSRLAMGTMVTITLPRTHQASEPNRTRQRLT